MALDQDLAAGFEGDGSTRPGPATARGEMSASMSASLPGEGSSAPPLVDTDALGRLVSRFSGIDFSGVDLAVGGATAQGSVGLPSTDTLLAPAQPFLRLAGQVQGGGALALLGQLRAQPDPNTFGMDGIATSLRHLMGVRRGATASSLISAVQRALPVPIDIDGTLDKVGETGLVARDLVTLVGGLMALHGAAEDVRDHSALIDRLLIPETIAKAAARARTWAAAPSVAAAIAAVADPDDVQQVDDAERVVRELITALGDLEALIVRGMGFGEATLVHHDPAAAVVRLEAAAALLRTVDVNRIRGAAIAAASAVDRHVPAIPGSPASDFAAVWAEVTAIVGAAVTAINGLPTDPLTRPVNQALGAVTGVFRQINEVFGAISGAIRGAFAAVRQVIEAIDLRAVARAIETFLQPLVDAIEQLDALLATVMGALGDVADALRLAVQTVTGALATGAGFVREAFDTVGNALRALNLKGLVEDLRGGIQAVADELHRVQLRPYFDTAIDVMNTSADVVSVIPFGLLPDSAKQELDTAIQPIQAIDFQHDVADVLKAQLDEILDRVDEDVLGAVSDAYRDVVTFLEGIDPRGHVEQLDVEFDAFVARVRDLDPEAALRPVFDAVESIRAEIAGLDLRERVIAPIERGFDQVLAGYDQLDPAPLLQPIEDQVGQLRQQIIDLTHIDQWAAKLDELYKVIDRFLAAFDLTGTGEWLDSQIDAALAGVRPDDGSSILGTVVAGLLESTGVVARPRSFVAAASWIGGADGAAEVRAMVTAGGASLAHARGVVAGLDLQALAAELDVGFRRVRAALDAHPPGSRLRLRLDAPVDAVAPLDHLGVHGADHARYLAALDRSLAVVRALESAGMSEVTATSEGLRAALRPLAGARSRLLAIPQRVGIDLTGKDLREVIAALLAELRPSRLLGAVTPITTALRDKVRTVLLDGLVRPVQAGIAELQQLVANLDISIFRTELTALHGAIRAELEAFRPSTLLAPTLTALETMQTRLVTYDPLDPIRVLVDGFHAVVDTLEDFRPSTLLDGLLDAYDEVLDVARGLDVRELLAPIMEALRDIEVQLDDGLDGAAGALTQLQQSLGSLGGGSASASVSVTA